MKIIELQSYSNLIKMNAIKKIHQKEMAHEVQFNPHEEELNTKGWVVAAPPSRKKIRWEEEFSLINLMLNSRHNLLFCICWHSSIYFHSNGSPSDQQRLSQIILVMVSPAASLGCRRLLAKRSDHEIAETL